MPNKAPESRSRRAATSPDSAARWAYTTFLLHPDQLLALKQIAAVQQSQRGGKADQSAVLREVLDALAQDRELPEGLKKALLAGLKTRPKS